MTETPTDAPDPRVGTTLGGYEIQALLGRGGMGVVYLARDPRLGRKVALKVLAPDLAQDESFRNRFIRESQMAAATDHPNIIPVYETGESEGVLFLAMRYVDGTDLRQVIREQGPLEPARAMSIVGQIGSALDAAHARGLVHRDIKPANVLLTTVGSDEDPIDHVYLTDFGLTKRSDSRSHLTETGGFMGTIDYMSPEQIEGKQIDHRTDLYALGCVLYESLTGVVPYERDSDVAVMYAHLMDDRPLVSALRPDLSTEIDAVVARSMSRNPDDRYPNSVAMIADARRALGMTGAGPSVEATPPASSSAGHASPIASTPSRVRRLAPFVAAAVLLVGVTGYFVTRAGDAPSDPDVPGPAPEATTAAGTTGRAWTPAADSTLQLQLSGRVDTSYEADTYALDLFDTPASVVEELHEDGRKVLCYISAGAQEKWRPDASAFPGEVLGDNLQGSPTERWLDIRELATLRPLMTERVGMCAEKGFDGAAFDNVDGYANDSGFNLNRSHQVEFNRMLAELAHAEGLAAGVTNAPALAMELEPDFALAISTGCFQFDECGLFRSFIAAGKPVFVIEFELATDQFCEQAEEDGFTAQRKRYNLGAWRQACWD